MIPGLCIKLSDDTYIFIITTINKLLEHILQSKIAKISLR